MPARKKSKPRVILGRDPDRTRERILAAALHEFARRGFAGARVAAIARSACINKRMLYHYFHDKSGLFSAVLRHTIARRLAQAGATSADGETDFNPAAWFRQNCKDADWVRLLAWESLQTDGDSVCDERERRDAARLGVARIQRQQVAKKLRGDMPAEFLALAKVSLSMFPFALPQVARLITGKPSHQRKFQRDYAQFLETIWSGFRP